MTDEQYEKAKEIEARKNHLLALRELIVTRQRMDRNMIIKDARAEAHIVLQEDDITMILDAIAFKCDFLDHEFKNL